VSVAALEGRLTVRLGADGARLVSTPPLPVARLFEGRGTEQVLTLLPRLYAVCGRAHLAAATEAMEAARAHTPRPEQKLARDMIVDAEALREHLLRILTGWGSALQQAVHPVVISDVLGLPERLATTLGCDWSIFSAADGSQPEFGRTAAALASIDMLLERQILGCKAEDWAAFVEVDAVMALAGSRAFGPRFLQWLIDDGHAAVGAAVLPALPEFTPASLAQGFTGAGTTQGSAPEWDGGPRETGAFARQRNHPLVQAFGARWGQGLITRSVARLLEVALLATRLHGADPHPLSMVADGATGYGIVETARGRLAHRVTLEGNVVRRMQILAPTEWNCHPRGVMAACLGAVPLDAHARRRAGLVVECIDPCVAYAIEVDGYA
jgi:uptake hydrogenase large subunit